MSANKKNFITLDSTDLFDDSDIDEEISSFLQDFESRDKTPAEGQKDVQTTKKGQKCTTDTKSKAKVGQVMKTNEDDASSIMTLKKRDVKSNQEKGNVKTINSGVNSETHNQATKIDGKTTEDIGTKKNVGKTSEGIGTKKDVGKTSEDIGTKKNVQKITDQIEKIPSKTFEDTCVNSSFSSKDIVVDDVNFFIADGKYEGNKSIEDSYCSPKSSESSELLESKELEQEIKSFLSKEFVFSENGKQSHKLVEDKSFVTTKPKNSCDNTNVSSPKIGHEKVKHECKVVQKTDRIEILKENTKISNIQSSKNDQLEIHESKGSVKEIESSCKKIQDKTMCEDNVPHTQESTEKVDHGPKSGGNIQANANIAIESVQDSIKEVLQPSVSNKGKTVLSEVHDSKKGRESPCLLNKEKSEVNSTILDSQKDSPQQLSSCSGKSESTTAPELGKIVEGNIKDGDDKKYISKDLESYAEGSGSDVTSEGTKQINKRKLEETSEKETDSKKSKKELFSLSDYEKQLEIKMANIKDKLSRSSDFIINKYSKESLISRNILRNNGLICDVDDMRKCPPNEWMATMCSFIIGIGRLSNDLTVGFQTDSSENKKTFGCMVKDVSEVEHNYPDHVIGAAKVFEKMIQAHARGKGGRPHPHGIKTVWKALHIYTNKKQELMLIISVSADSTSIINEIYNVYVDFFKNGEGKKFHVTSVYITCYYKIGIRDECWIEHLTGNQSLDLLRGLYVNYIGITEPWSNMYGFKMLCCAVEELLMPTRTTTVLEIFCSTGLLGHYLSKIAGEVLAYDDPNVIRSTSRNAVRSNIIGVQYFSGDPQSELLYRIEMARYNSIVGVINWNPNFNRQISVSLVMKILREVKKLEKLVIVTTLETLSLIPFRTLCAPYDMERGEPFFPVKAIPIDTMPLQDGCVVAVLFKRQFESVRQDSKPKMKAEWWNWVKDESNDRRKEDEEKKGKRSSEERRDNDMRKKRNHEEDRRGKRRFDDEDYRRGNLEFVDGIWLRRKKDDEQRKNKYITEEDEKRKQRLEEERKRKHEEEIKRKTEEEMKRKIEEEIKRKIQEQLDIRRLQELERMQKEQEEHKKKEEEEKKKKEMEKAKRLTLFKRCLKQEQRRRVQGEQKVEVEREQPEEDSVMKQKEIEEDEKKLVQAKGKKKQLDKEESKPLEQLRKQIEEEKVRAKRAAERKRRAHIGEKKRFAEEERRQQRANQMIAVWEQPPMQVGMMEQRNLEEVHWRVLEEEKYRRCLEQEAYRKVENDTVVFDYNHGNTVDSSVPATPSSAVSRPVMKWLEKLREVSGEQQTPNLSAAPRLLSEKPAGPPPSLLSLHVEKPPLSMLPTSSDAGSSGLLSAHIRPLLQPPGSFNISGRNDHLPEVERSNVASNIRQSSSAEYSRPLKEPFVQQQGSFSNAYCGQTGFGSHPDNRYSYGGFGRNDAKDNTVAGLRGMSSMYGSNYAPNHGFTEGVRYGDQTRKSGDIHPSDSFSFKQTLQDVRTYGKT